MLGAAAITLMVLGFPRTPATPGIEWVVVLEAAADANATLIDRGTTEAILRSLEDDSVVGLHSPDRFAVQVKLRETDIEKAFLAAMQRWRRVLPLIPRGWSLVRGEILTREEFDRDAQANSR